MALGVIVAFPCAQRAARTLMMKAIISEVTLSLFSSGGAPTEAICGTVVGKAT
jgi:hypothetical protein